MYNSTESSVCSDTVSDNAHVKKLVHVDLLNYDNSHNGEDKGREQEVDKGETEHTVICDCGRQPIFTLFKCVVFVAIAVGFINMCCGCTVHLKTVYLKRHEDQI